MTNQRNAQITLTEADGSTSLVNLNLWAEAPNLPGGWRVEHITPDAPRIATDEANYQNLDPNFGLVYDTNSWHRGFGSDRVEGLGKDALNRYRYGYSEGVLASFSGQLVPGYQEESVDILIRNGRFEKTNASSIDPWAGTNATLASSTDSMEADSGPGTNLGAMTMTLTGDGGYASDVYQGTVSVLQGVEVTLGAYVKRVSGSGTIKVSVKDNEGQTDSSTSSSTSYALVTANHTIHGSATSLEWRITGSTSGDVWRVDSMFVIPAGGVNFAPSAQEFGGSLYVACGRLILVWDEELDYWKAVEHDGNNVFTSLISHEGALYAGRGTADNYRRSTNGTTWADPATNSGNARLAQFFARGLNAAGDWVLYKNRANQMSVTSDGSDTANWGNEIQAGDPDRNVTGLYMANSTVYVGREDGLFLYSLDTNRFHDLEPEANFFPEAENMETAIGRGGALWAAGGNQTFWKIIPTGMSTIHQWEDMTHLFRASTFRGFGGRVTATAQDQNSLFVVIADDLASNADEFTYDFPIDFLKSGASSTVKLIAVRTQRESPGSPPETVAHTVATYAISNVDQMTRYSDGSLSSIFIFGRSTNTVMSATETEEPRIVRLHMPIDNENPALNSLRRHRLTGRWFSPWIDFNFPDVEKAAAKLTITSLNFEAAKDYVTFYYKTDDATDDDAAGWTLWGDDGVFDTSPSETKASITSTPVTFRRIRLRADWTLSSSSDAPPTVVGMVLHATWNPTDTKEWTAIARLSDRRSMQMRRVPQRTLLAADMANLRTMISKPFVLLQDPDGTQHTVKLKMSEQIVSNRIYATRNTLPDQVRILTLNMTEVVTG